MKSLFNLVCVLGVVSNVYAYNKLTNLFLQKLTEIKSQADMYIAYHGLTATSTPNYPYWNFIPDPVTNLDVNTGKSFTWSTDCFKSNKANVVRSADGKSLNVKITSSGATSHTCVDNYMILTTSALNLCTSVKPEKTPTPSQVVTEVVLDIPDDVTTAELWDIDAVGVRLLRFRHSREELLGNLLHTVELFAGEASLAVPPKAAEANIDFLRKYSNIDIQPRDNALNVWTAASEVHSGDAFYVQRFDGLNPMLAWAMGSTTGHVTTAMWIDGELYVCESTTDSAYWPTDYIQKTPWLTWLNQTTAADMQVVWAPLSEAARKNYNETAAQEFFKSVEGLDYGYMTMMWGWLDTAKDNFPCVPNADGSTPFTNCLTWDVLSPLLAFIDRSVNDVGDLMFNPGFAKRLNISDADMDGLRITDYFKIAGDRGMTSNDLIWIPEQDSWVYNMTKYDKPAEGKNMVCCVFVCNTWKIAGIFGDLSDSIQCGEQTNWDDYVLDIHADTYRQIVGTYSLKLNDFRTKTPYAHMGEKCASVNPEYEKSDTC